MRPLALLAAAVALAALLGAVAARRGGNATMTEFPTDDKAKRVKAIYERARARIAELKRRRRETAEGFARAAERAKADQVRKSLR